MRGYCVDTHALIWYLTAHPALSKRARSILDGGFEGQHTLVVPTLAILELFHKNLKTKFIEMKKLHEMLNRSTITVVPFDQRVLLLCYRLPVNLDIHDRVIAATALVYQCPLITKDERLRELRVIETIW